MGVILKTWMGVSSGDYSDHGSGGYPERQFQLVETLDDIVAGYDPKAQYYTLTELDVADLVKAARILKEK